MGYEISRSLDAPLDVFVSRKLGAPGQPEFGIGAVAAGGVRILNKDVVRRLGIPDDYVERITAQELAEVNRRLRYFRGDRPETEVGGRTAILVDDGLATGVTARAAVAGPAVAEAGTPGPGRARMRRPDGGSLRAEVDELVCLETPSDLGAIGFWYKNFEQTPDERGRATARKSQERAESRQEARRRSVRTRARPCNRPVGDGPLPGTITAGFRAPGRGERYVRQVYAFYPGRQAGRGVPSWIGSVELSAELQRRPDAGGRGGPGG